MIEQIAKEVCTGCGACEALCPVGAIQRQKGEDGFLYPFADDTCISCGKCLKACPANHPKEPGSSSHIKVFAMQHKQEEILSKSSSGGVFYALASSFVENGGIVFGAAMQDGAKRLCHRGVTKKEDLAPLLQSKYLQSDTVTAYSQIKALLSEGKMVLYVSTPCQVQGLKAFLGKDFTGLYTVDFICHGTPSADLWQKYAAYAEKKYHTSLKAVSFRDKKYGWYDFSVRMTFENGKCVTEGLHDNLYMRAFLKDLSLRGSCYHCSANCYRSGSDLTLADFWNIERVSSQFSNNKGTSAVLVHSSKGTELLSKIENLFTIEERTPDEILKYNRVLETSVARPASRELYLAEAEKGNFEKADDRYVCTSVKERMKKRVKRLLKG